MSSSTNPLITEASVLAAKHVTVSYFLIAVLVAILGLCSFGGYLAFKFADAQLARAEASEQRFEAAQKSWQDQLRTDAAQRQQATAQQQIIVKVVHDRDVAADNTVAQVLSPGKTAQVAIVDLGAAYKGLVHGIQQAVPSADGDSIAFPVPVVQQFTATKIDRDRLAADLGDTKNTLTLEEVKTATLTTDLTGAQKTLSDCQDTVKKYKGAAKAGLFKRVVKGAGVVALVIAAAYAGHKL